MAAFAESGADGSVSEQSVEETFHLGQGRQEVHLESRCSSRKKYRVHQDETASLLSLALDVLIEEGCQALSPKQLNEVFDHWVYEEEEHLAVEYMREDLDDGVSRLFVRVLQKLIDTTGLAAFERRLAIFLPRFYDAIKTLRLAGIMSDRFGVYMYDARKAFQESYHTKLDVDFIEVLEKMLNARTTHRVHLWRIFGLHRQVRLFRQRDTTTTATVPRLELLALMKTPSNSFLYPHPKPLQQILQVFFHCRLLSDPDDQSFVLCFPPC